jgi:hypothetical protein
MDVDNFLEMRCWIHYQVIKWKRAFRHVKPHGNYYTCDHIVPFITILHDFKLKYRLSGIVDKSYIRLWQEFHYLYFVARWATHAQQKELRHKNIDTKVYMIICKD